MPKPLCHVALFSFLLTALLLATIIPATPATATDAASPSATPTDAASLQRAFAQPPDDARIMMRWWWFGPAVTQPELEREMRAMKAGGIGGFEVQPVYPLSLDDPAKGIRNLPFLSPEFLGALRFTSEKARELGLRFDMTLGSGWPYGGPMIPVTQAAGRLRTYTARLAAGSSSAAAPKLAEGESLIAAFAIPTVNGTTQGKAYHEMTLGGGAAQRPEGFAGEALVYYFIAGRTGMKVKRPAVGAEGYVLDHYDPAAIANFIQAVAEPELKAVAANPPHAVFCDSLEVGGTDWTGDFLAEFQKRRGYDLKPLLPALVTDIGEQTAAIRHDWGQTLTEVFTERFVAVFQKFAADHGTRFRYQGYGTPPSSLASYAAADLPEGEGYRWQAFCTSRWAASASHLLGKPVTSSETWTWLHSPVFRATPLDMKAEADLHFLQGINQLIGHGWPYTPPGVEAPGWRFYAAAVFNDSNPWWIVMPDVAKYLQRVSFLLRQGTPANDVALYLPNDDAWAHFENRRVSLTDALGQRIGRDVIPQILDGGYNFDFFDDGLLAQRGRVQGNALAFGDGRYRIVVLPGVERIPLATLRQLEAFARSGGILVATRRLPALAPGYKASDAERKEIAALAQRLFSGPGARGIFVQDEAQLGKALARRLKPDVTFTPETPEIGIVHRRTAAGEVYFLANTSNLRKSVPAVFRVTGLQAEWWDPLTGEAAPAEIVSRPPGGTKVQIDLEPYASRVLFFTDDRTLPAPAKRIAGPPALDLSDNWMVTFGPGAKPVKMAVLHSWTEDKATKNFSGVATYERKFSMPPDLLGEGVALRLDLGQTGVIPGMPMGRFQALSAPPVREAAVVYVNGKRAGALWCPPYNVDITALVRPGENQIKIEVANLAVNAMAGKPLPDYRELSAKYGERFQAQDMRLIRPEVSGLSGPIKITATRQQ